MRRMSLALLLITITLMIFLAGFRAGVHYAAHFEERTPVFVSLER